eukprot:GHVN01099397.1.p1 GENE.GHVN01099397.1~~GHVN01099397.1.p1  ORF type:complete len:730 (-),score=165.45 GHVN01099397.1:73-2262(-)
MEPGEPADGDKVTESLSTGQVDEGQLVNQPPSDKVPKVSSTTKSGKEGDVAGVESQVVDGGTVVAGESVEGETEPKTSEPAKTGTREGERTEVEVIERGKSTVAAGRDGAAKGGEPFEEIRYPIEGEVREVTEVLEPAELPEVQVDKHQPLASKSEGKTPETIRVHPQKGRDSGNGGEREGGAPTKDAREGEAGADGGEAGEPTEASEPTEAVKRDESTMPKKERTESQPPSIVDTGAGSEVRAVTEKPEPTELLEVEPKPEGAVAEPADTSEGEETQSPLMGAPPADGSEAEESEVTLGSETDELSKRRISQVNETAIPAIAGGVEAAEGGEVTEASEVTGPPPSPNVPGATEATGSEKDEGSEGAEATELPTREAEPISGSQPPKGERDGEAEERKPTQSTEESEPPQLQTTIEQPGEGDGGVGAKAAEPAERDELVVATPTIEGVNIDAGGEIRTTEIETPVVTESTGVPTESKAVVSTSGRGVEPTDSGVSTTTEPTRATEAPTTGAITSEEPPTHATRLAEPDYWEGDRQSCTAVMKQLGFEREANMRGFARTGFKTLFCMLGLPQRDLPPSSDKIVMAALQGLRLWAKEGLRPDEFIQLCSCAVDDRGRTVYHKIVEYGMVGSLDSPEGPLMIGGAQFRDGVWVPLHIAASTGNARIARTVLRHAGSVSQMTQLLDARNKDEQTALNLAESLSETKGHSVILALKPINRMLKAQLEHDRGSSK